MRVHVEGQVVDLVEGLVADGALVLLLPAVRQLMVLVVTWDIQTNMHEVMKSPKHKLCRERNK